MVSGAFDGIGARLLLGCPFQGQDHFLLFRQYPFYRFRRERTFT